MSTLDRQFLFVGMLVVVLVGSADAAAPASQYTVGTAGGMGIVTDNMTKLTWQQVPVSTQGVSARYYCATLGAGWRLPTMKELLTLVDFAQPTSPDPAAFPGSQSGDYWSSSLGMNLWLVRTDGYYDDSTPSDSSKKVRCVR